MALYGIFRREIIVIWRLRAEGIDPAAAFSMRNLQAAALPEAIARAMQCTAHKVEKAVGFLTAVEMTRMVSR